MPVIGNNVQRGACIEQPGVIKTFALTTLGQQRHGERGRQVDPVVVGVKPEELAVKDPEAVQPTSALSAVT